MRQAHEFLSESYRIDEKQQCSYGKGYSEGVRSTALSYVRWLLTGASDSDVLQDARENLAKYIEWEPQLNRREATLMIPKLMYTESYTTIARSAERLSIGVGAEQRRKVSGLFGHALRFATATDDDERHFEKGKMKVKVAKELVKWASKGGYLDIAYSLHALFPRPAGPPCRLLEECWKYVPEDSLG